MTTTHRVEEHAKRTTLWYGLVLDDPHPPPEHLRERFPYEPRSTQIPVSRYTSREWHELERKHLWRRGLADGLPRGEHPGRRQLHRL